MKNRKKFDDFTEQKIKNTIDRMVNLSNYHSEIIINSDDYAYLTLAEEDEFPVGSEFKAIGGRELLTTGHYGQIGSMKIKVVPVEVV